MSVPLKALRRIGWIAPRCAHAAQKFGATAGWSLHIDAAMANAPAPPDTIDQWADRIGMARRTLTRRFAAETGSSFAQWRQQSRLLKAVELLSLGEAVTTVALTVGYSSVSAFIETFRKNFGCTPARFFEEGMALPQTKKKPA